MIAATMLFGCTNKEDTIVKLHDGYYAFCGASGAIATGDSITVQGVKFAEGCAGNDGSTRWDGKSVWSLYHYFDTSTYIPQFNPATLSWEMMKPGNRAFIVNTDSAHTSESNMFCMPCQIIDTTETGIILARCFGPLNEAAVPLRKPLAVKSGMESITAAIPGKPYPVGTPVPLMKLTKKLKTN